MSFYRIINILDNLKNLSTKFSQQLLKIGIVLPLEMVVDILNFCLLSSIYERQELLTILRAKN